MFFFNEIFVLPMAEGLCMFAARYNSGTQATWSGFRLKKSL